MIGHAERQGLRADARRFVEEVEAGRRVAPPRVVELARFIAENVGDLAPLRRPLISELERVCMGYTHGEVSEEERNEVVEEVMERLEEMDALVLDAAEELAHLLESSDGEER